MPKTFVLPRVLCKPRIVARQRRDAWDASRHTRKWQTLDRRTSLLARLRTNRNDRSWNDHADVSSHDAMDLKEIMAINLRRIRHVKKMTQEELADSAGLSVRYIGAIERADVSASVTVLGRIAEALGVDATELVKQTAHHSHRAR